MWDLSSLITICYMFCIRVQTSRVCASKFGCSINLELNGKLIKTVCIHRMWSVQAGPYMGQLVTQPVGEGHKSGISTTSSFEKKNTNNQMNLKYISL